MDGSDQAVPAHPRSRGENSPPSRIDAGHAGSSPLTRGKPLTDAGGALKERLIPAHAGKTCFWSCPRAASRAHPRSRGENPSWALSAARGAGSSPLTRGKQALHPRPDHDHGLIPAHAGKTRVFRSTSFRATAHPRSRGENAWQADAWARPRGSSPLTRGKHVLT